jgi:hypothetical protein
VAAAAPDLGGHLSHLIRPRPADLGEGRRGAFPAARESCEGLESRPGTTTAERPILGIAAGRPATGWRPVRRSPEMAQRAPGSVPSPPWTDPTGPVSSCHGYDETGTGSIPHRPAGPVRSRTRRRSSQTGARGPAMRVDRASSGQCPPAKNRRALMPSPPGIGMGHLGEMGGSRASAELEPHPTRARHPVVQTSGGHPEDDQATVRPSDG